MAIVSTFALLLALAAAPALAQAPAAELPPSMAALPQGSVRLIFRAGETALPPGAGDAIGALGRRLAAAHAGQGRVTVEAQASGPEGDGSAARRLSLARAQAVRAALVAGGLADTRVDIRALGVTPARLDAADILPPGTARSERTRP